MSSFPHQGNLESKTKFPNPPHQQTLCLSIMSVCWVDTARHATAQWLCMRSRSARMLLRTLLVSCRLGLQPQGCGNLELKSKFSKPAASCSTCARLTPRLPSTFPKTKLQGRHSIAQWFCACAHVQRSVFDPGKNVVKNLSLP